MIILKPCVLSFFLKKKWTAVAVAIRHFSVPSLSKRAHQFAAWHCCSCRRAESCRQGCDAHHFCLESNSARSWGAVTGERQTEAQTGWWKTRSGFAGWVSDDERGERERHKCCNLCSFLYRPFSLLYLCTHQSLGSHIYSLSFSFAHCPSSSLSFFLSLSSNTMTSLFSLLR